MRRWGGHQAHLVLLLAGVVGCVQVQDRAVMLSNERSRIERTYELTKYLDHQLKEIKDTYLSYLGPPFSDPGFSPPRPNVSSLAVPSAATRVDLWRGLENGARLAQNQRAYSVLLSAVRELARSTLCPYLQSSLLHFCSGLSGLLGSISGLMNALGYPPSLHGNGPANQRYDPLLTSQQRSSLNGPVPLRSNPARNQGGLSASGVREGTPGVDGERKRDRERDRGRRGRRREGESWAEREEEERDEGLERWGGRRRKLLAVDEEDDSAGQEVGYEQNSSSNNVNSTHTNYFSKYSEDEYSNFNSNNSQFPLDALLQTQLERSISREKEEEEEQQPSVPLLFSAPSLHPMRSRRALSPPSTLSPFTLLFPDAVGQGSLTAGRPAFNDFTRKVEGFWVLRELQSWLWRSAKDFTRLKKRLRV
ncbi:cardiotrophin-like cytokine factor 1 [Astyanax mexicanus]|uniref:Cardiotrophin-like cytokine factor 1 n=1 Tax=Astyanax mexicanus TaxID=7994 RepID=A0A8T2LK88_ASTMX|nr:cardiotrophin-like cytokine factor 1 [Astyanax mexicanus]